MVGPNGPLASATTEPVAGGHYLVYAPAALSIGKIVFYDAHGHVINELPLQPQS